MLFLQISFIYRLLSLILFIPCPSSKFDLNNLHLNQTANIEFGGGAEGGGGGYGHHLAVS
jgi:hypothetical protein